MNFIKINGRIDGKSISIDIRDNNELIRELFNKLTDNNKTDCIYVNAGDWNEYWTMDSTMEIKDA